MRRSVSLPSKHIIPKTRDYVFVDTVDSLSGRVLHGSQILVKKQKLRASLSRPQLHLISSPFHAIEETPQGDLDNLSSCLQGSFDDPNSERMKLSYQLQCIKKLQSQIKHHNQMNKEAKKRIAVTNTQNTRLKEMNELLANKLENEELQAQNLKNYHQGKNARLKYYHSSKSDHLKQQLDEVELLQELKNNFDSKLQNLQEVKAQNQKYQETHLSEYKRTYEPRYGELEHSLLSKEEELTLLRNELREKVSEGERLKLAVGSLENMLEACG